MLKRCWCSFGFLICFPSLLIAQNLIDSVSKQKEIKINLSQLAITQELRLGLETLSGSKIGYFISGSFYFKDYAGGWNDLDIPKITGFYAAKGYSLRLGINKYLSAKVIPNTFLYHKLQVLYKNVESKKGADIKSKLVTDNVDLKYDVLGSQYIVSLQWYKMNPLSMEVYVGIGGRYRNKKSNLNHSKTCDTNMIQALLSELNYPASSFSIDNSNCYTFYYDYRPEMPTIQKLYVVFPIGVNIGYSF